MSRLLGLSKQYGAVIGINSQASLRERKDREAAMRNESLKARDPLNAGSSTRYVSRAPKLGYVGPLDGLRAVAVLMVVTVHLGVLPVIGGIKSASFTGGVDLFFVVSGFLITSLLLQEDRARGRIDLKQFYIRRGLRLLPGLGLVLAFTLLISSIIDGGKFFTSALKEVGAAFFYVYHVVYVSSVGAGEAKETVRFLPQLWSLSVEEHFYLIIAGLMILLIRKNWVRQFAVLAVGFIVAGLIARFANVAGPMAFWFQRPDNLLVGVVLAIVNAEMPTTLSSAGERKLRWAGTIGLIVAFTSLMLSTKIFDKLGLAFTFSELSSLGIPKREMARIGEVRWGLAWTNFGFTAIAFGVAPLILAMIRLRDFWPSKLFSITPLRYLGRLSYTIYIWHVPWFLFVAYLRDQMPKSSVPADLVALVLLIPGLFGVVVLAHRYVELPALRLKARFTPDPDAADIARKEAV